MKTDIEKKVIEIVSKSINFSQKIDINSSNKNVKKWDSLAHLNIIIMLENEFSEIKSSDIAELTSIRKIIDYIKK